MRKKGEISKDFHAGFELYMIKIRLRDYTYAK